MCGSCIVCVARAYGGGVCMCDFEYLSFSVVDAERILYAESVRRRTWLLDESVGVIIFIEIRRIGVVFVVVGVVLIVGGIVVVGRAIGHGTRKRHSILYIWWKTICPVEMDENCRVRVHPTVLMRYVPGDDFDFTWIIDSQMQPVSVQTKRREKRKKNSSAIDFYSAFTSLFACVGLWRSRKGCVNKININVDR